MAHKQSKARAEVHQRWELRLYVANWEPESAEAWMNLKKVCERYLPGLYKIELVDLLKNPKHAREDQILALPTVVRRSPLPEKRIIGKLSDVERVVTALGIRPKPGTLTAK